MKAKLKLTPLGAHLATLPVDAGMGKLLVLGCLFGIPREVCVLASALSTKSPFKASVSKGKGESEKQLMEPGPARPRASPRWYRFPESRP